jgi:cardiolipin synthase
MQLLKFHISFQTLKSLVKYFTLPNIVTGTRIILSPVLLYCLIKSYWIASFFICFGAGLTDWLDGYVARKYNNSTQFGAHFDPVADKVLMTFSYIGLGMTGLIPAALCFLIISRDVLILCGATYVLKKQLPINLDPTKISKWNTLFQIVLIGYTVLVQFLYHMNIDSYMFDVVLMILIFITTITTIVSGWGYAQRLIKKN